MTYRQLDYWATAGVFGHITVKGHNRVWTTEQVRLATVLGLLTSIGVRAPLKVARSINATFHRLPATGYLAIGPNFSVVHLESAELSQRLADVGGLFVIDLQSLNNY